MSSISPDYDFVMTYCKKIGVRPHVLKHVAEAYIAGYDAKSDGITGFCDLTWERFKGDKNQKNPMGVMHDHCYYQGALSRKECDMLFRDGLIDFRWPIVARIAYAVLRIVGWYAWDIHRSQDHLKPKDN